MRQNICVIVWLLTATITLCFYLLDPYDLTLDHDHDHFIVLSSIIVISLQWPFISHIMVRGVFQTHFTQKRVHSKNIASSTSVAINNVPRHALFADMKRLLVLCPRSFAIFVICWLPYAVFGCFIFFARDVSLKTYWLFPLQYFIHLVAFVNFKSYPLSELDPKDISDRIERTS